nr:unnamed protein product [Callosobruchus analis]
MKRSQTLLLHQTQPQKGITGTAKSFEDERRSGWPCGIQQSALQSSALQPSALQPSAPVIRHSTPCRE